MVAAVAAALVPSLGRPDDPGGFFASGAAALGTADRMAGLIGALPDPDSRRRLLLLLSALDSRGVNLLLSGRPVRMGDLEPAAAEDLLRGWAFSGIAQRRMAFQALKRLSQLAYYCWPPAGRPHPAWVATGYSGPL
ncbi:MAG TPA: hypothetical protein VD793_06345, partial [Gemmatimonadales bacterium]|nr:hypothetical protein [Gemmatimonadales bacterium]